MCLPHRSPPHPHPSFLSVSIILPAAICQPAQTGSEGMLRHMSPPVCSSFFTTAAQRCPALGGSACVAHGRWHQTLRRDRWENCRIFSIVWKRNSGQERQLTVWWEQGIWLCIRHPKDQYPVCLSHLAFYFFMLLPKHRCVFPLEGKFPPSKAALAMLAHEYGSGQLSYESIYLIYILLRDDAT